MEAIPEQSKEDGNALSQAWPMRTFGRGASRLEPQNFLAWLQVGVSLVRT